jgi:hypothetical protein
MTVEDEFDSPHAGVLAHPDLPWFLDEFRSSIQDGNGLGVLFEVDPVELKSGGPGYLWVAHIMVSSTLLKKLCPDFRVPKDGGKFTTVVARASTSSAELLGEVGRIMPRVLWHWVDCVIKGAEEAPASRLGRELRRLFPELKRGLLLAGWVQLS